MHDATRFELFGKLGVINYLVTVIELDAQTGEAGLDRLNIVVAATASTMAGMRSLITVLGAFAAHRRTLPRGRES